MDFNETPIGDPQLAGTVQSKHKRGRPKGSKSKAKMLPVPEPVVVEETIQEKESCIPVGDEQEGVKSCVDCVDYLLCKKSAKRNEVICDLFKDNFPNDTDDVDLPPDDVDLPPDEEGEEEEVIETTLFVCNSVSDNVCMGCPHATPHDPEDITNDCPMEWFCDDVEKNVKCVPV